MIVWRLIMELRPDRQPGRGAGGLFALASGAARRHQPPTEWTAWQLAFQPQLGHPWVALAFTGRLETALEGFEARPDDFFAGNETGA
jgi:hypothetical protein